MSVEHSDRATKQVCISRIMKAFQILPDQPAQHICEAKSDSQAQVWSLRPICPISGFLCLYFQTTLSGRCQVQDWILQIWRKKHKTERVDILNLEVLKILLELFHKDNIIGHMDIWT